MNPAGILLPDYRKALAAQIIILEKLQVVHSRWQLGYIDLIVNYLNHFST